MLHANIKKGGYRGTFVPLYIMADISLSLYQCGDDSRIVKKKLENEHTFSKITLKEDCSISHPVFILGAVAGSDEPQDTVGWWRKFNYCYCPNFDRYYFIENITFTRNRLVQIECASDVLMSFKDDILKTTQLITRQEHKQQRYIADTTLPIHSAVKTEIKEFGSKVGGDAYTLLLETVGKGGTVSE